MTLQLVVYEAQSLKDKRRAVRSVKERIRNRFNVSAAEVGHLDSRQRAVLGVALVSNEAEHIHECFDKIVDYVRRDSGVSLVDYHKETFAGSDLTG